MTRPSRKRRGCLPVLVLLLLMVLAAWLFSAQILTWAAAALVQDDGPHKADAIVVLGGDEYGQRVLKGAELAKAGYAPAVYVSGPRTCSVLFHLEIQYAERQGYPASYFHSVPLVGELATPLARKLVSLENFFARKASKRFCWSPAFTIPAARPVFGGWNALGRPSTSSPVPDPNFTPSTWWKTRQGQKTFLLEWAKTIAAALGD